MLEARLRRLPRFVERIELTYQKGPAYCLPEGPCLSPARRALPIACLRHYASRILVDMQLPHKNKR